MAFFIKKINFSSYFLGNYIFYAYLCTVRLKAIKIMQRIKDVSKIKMNEGNVLIKIHKKESKIILPDSDGDENPSVDYAEVVALGKKVEGLEVGNIILEFKTVYGFEWESSHYAIVHRLSIGMAVDKDNFDLSRKKPTSKIKI